MSFSSAQGGTRTRTAKRPTPLKRVCIPIPPPGHDEEIKPKIKERKVFIYSLLSSVSFWISLFCSSVSSSFVFSDTTDLNTDSLRRILVGESLRIK